MNTGPHVIDQALQLFGTETMPDITCILDRVNTFGDAEDYVKLIMKKQGHPLLDVEISSCNAYPQAIYHIDAQYGGISGNISKLNWRYYLPDEASKQTLTRTPMKNEDGSPAYCSETLPWVEAQWEIPAEQRNSFTYACNALYGKLHAAMVKGEPLDITLQQIKQQISVIEECHRQNPLTRL